MAKLTIEQKIEIALTHSVWSAGFYYGLADIFYH